MSLFSDIESLPEEPGVYLIKNEKDEVIYIGKAKVLKDRVKQHFTVQIDLKENKIQDEGKRVEWIITRNEVEALILEKKMVQQLKPKYNYKLKDDKASLMIRITKEEEYPRLLVVRESDKRVPKSVYFGPFISDKKLRYLIKAVLKIFPVCNCKNNIKVHCEKQMQIRCMREKLGRCAAPCKSKVSVEEYRKIVNNVIMFLNGEVGELLIQLEEQMWESAQNQNFEYAAKIRDTLKAVESILNIQKEMRFKFKNTDVLAFVTEDERTVICKITVRNQRISTIHNHLFTEEEFRNLKNLKKLYAEIGEKKKPSSVLLTESFEKKLDIDQTFTIISSKNENSKELLEIAEKNAKNELKKHFRTDFIAHETKNTLDELKEILKLKNYPEVINGFDISTLGGTSSVGSCVTFVEGKSKKSLYRKFRIKKPYSEPNDYEMMKEVIERRFLSEQLKNDPFPDLIVIDGGKGQLNIAKKVLSEIKLNVDLISIAKRNEEIFTEWSDTPIELPKNAQILRLIQTIRDESHRFAITYHKKIRQKKVSCSQLEEIKGIGKEKVRTLLEHFETIEGIHAASIEELRMVAKVNEKIALNIKETVRKQLNTSSYE